MVIDFFGFQVYQVILCVVQDVIGGGLNVVLVSENVDFIGLVMDLIIQVQGVV